MLNCKPESQVADFPFVKNFIIYQKRPKAKPSTLVSLVFESDILHRCDSRNESALGGIGGAPRPAFGTRPTCASCDAANSAGSRWAPDEDCEDSALWLGFWASLHSSTTATTNANKSKNCVCILNANVGYRIQNKSNPADTFDRLRGLVRQ